MKNEYLSQMGITQWKLRASTAQDFYGNLLKEQQLVGVVSWSQPFCENAESEEKTLLLAILKAFGFSLQQSSIEALMPEPRVVISFGGQPTSFYKNCLKEVAQFSFPPLSALLHSPEKKKAVWQEWLAAKIEF